MRDHTRREFLKRTAVAGGAAALASMPGAWAQDAEAPAKMCIARWNADVTDMKVLATKLTEQAIASLGGMKRFVSKGDVVWVKPNMAWDRAPEFAANTNPDVVATLVRMCLEAGAKTVKVGDRTCNDAKRSYPSSGIAAAAKEAGAEVKYIDENRFRKADIGGERLKEWEIYPEIVESDLVINVPIAKNHTLATATLCMKNYMGVVGGERGKWHQAMSECLTDITAYMKPQLCVLDAIRVLTASGPTGGNLDDVKQLCTVAAGTDIVAMDSFGAEILGYDIAKVSGITMGGAKGLGQTDYRKLSPKEIKVA